MSAMLGIAKAALWPEANLAEMLIKDEKDQPSPPVCTPIPSLTEHLAYQARTLSCVVLGQQSDLAYKLMKADMCLL